MKNKTLIIITLLSIFLLSACMDARSLCVPGEIQYRERSHPFPALEDQTPAPQQVEIKGKMLNFDHVVSGQLCNNHLEGIVYVGCEIEIYEWENASNFLDQCDFTVAPNTIIYVAAHNNTAYYKGCNSCHMSDQ